MKTSVALALALSLFASLAHAGANVVVTRVPEPETWALVGIAAAAFGAARYLRRRNRDTRK